MTTNREKVAEIIEGYYPACLNCRETIPEVGECPECGRICKVIARALADAGLIFPDLPEPDDDEFGPTWSQVFNYQHGPDWTDVKGSVCTHNGTVEIQGNDTHIHTPEEARTLALALLAAANHAHKEETNE